MPDQDSLSKLQAENAVADLGCWNCIELNGADRPHRCQRPWSRRGNSL